MKAHAVDHAASRTNPWGLTPKQCQILRLICKHGNAKAVWVATDIPQKTVQDHLQDARRRMGLIGHDFRLIVNWVTWKLNHDHQTDH